LKRIYSQVNSIQDYFSSFVQDLYTRSHQSHQSNAVNDSNHLIGDKFGFHKLIFTLTKFGKIVILDNSQKGAVVSTLFDPRLKEEILREDDRMKIIEKERTKRCERVYPIWIYLQKSNVFSPLITFLTKGGYIFSFNPFTDKALEMHNLNVKIKQSLLMHHANEDGVKGIVILDEGDDVHFYPPSTKATFTAQKDNYYLLVGHQSNKLLQGYSFVYINNGNEDKFRGQRVWSFSLPTLTESCLKIGWKEKEERVHSQGKLLSDISVLYKYLNPNLVVVINEGEERSDEEVGGINVVHFYLVDAITGAVYYSVVHRKASGPVHLVHSENFIIYSFYNERQRRTEISSLELFEGKEMPSPPPVRTPPQIVEHISFIFPTGIRTMKETRTEKGITNKHILIALSSGAILSFPRVFLDPRRAASTSRYSSSAAASEEGGVYLPPYIPELPIPSEGIINYNQTLSRVKDISVGVSYFESTCLVFITGLDLYYTRVTPSKTFDILKDDFDHLLIIIVLLSLILFSFITKYLASRKTLKAAWK